MPKTQRPVDSSSVPSMNSVGDSQLGHVEKKKIPQLVHRLIKRNLYLSSADSRTDSVSIYALYKNGRGFIGSIINRDPSDGDHGGVPNFPMEIGFFPCNLILAPK